MLGSVRTVTDAVGAVVECRDYMPFGRTLSSADNGRGAAGCHPAAPDSGITSRTAQGFTGKERDDETGLDYFGARYMSSPLGRFISPDQPLLDQHIDDPASWNLYIYARNNPLVYIDTTGEAIELLGNDEERKRALELLKKSVGNADAASRLYINEIKNGDKTRYFVGIKGNVNEFRTLSETSNDLADIVGHKQIIEFGLTVQDLSEYGGAATFQPGKIGNDNVRVLVNPDQTGIANRRLNPNTILGAVRWGGQQDVPRGERWIVRPMTPEIEAWHEFGHALEYINSGWLARRLFGMPNNKALEWENRMREQLYGPIGLSNAPRIKH
jgi:RHS repeat-associated protein